MIEALNSIGVLISVARAAQELIQYIAPPIIEANPPALKLKEALKKLEEE